MPVIVMKVIKTENHPNADSLKVYQMQAPGYDTVQIIANLDNFYEIGDRVAIALVDTLLDDGTKIKPTKLRGLPSYGMALGKVEAEIATDLSSTYCPKKIADFVEFQSWPSIELLHNLCRNFEILGEAPTITYRAKIKLDGTNAAVQIFSDGRVSAQSRTQIITPENDNAGFARWVEKNLDFFASLSSAKHLTIFGEWCGKGIQKRTAISQIDRAVFAIFALQFGGIEGQIAKLEVIPENIRNFIPKHPDIFILPFHRDPITLDFSDRAQLQASAETLNSMVEEVENIDPWVKDTFGIEGLGEGLVFYPETNAQIERLGYSELLFKAKGEKHQVVRTKTPVQIDPEKVESLEEFVKLFVTPARLEQGVAVACQGEYNLKKMGEFLQWFVNDVKKESVAELERANLTWQDANKAVMKAARDWYQKKSNTDFQS